MNNIELDFLRSAMADDSFIFPNKNVPEWINERRNSVYVDVKEISLDRMRGWECELETGNYRHKSGGFFKIEGLRVKTNWGNIRTWEQPIINQPEIGYLGFISKKFDGILHFLVQAKIEPGNINTVQVSPTLQATKSNYTQVHKGGRPRYLEYFNGEKKVDVLLDQLQSEQGARFLRKRNRNIIVKLPDCEDVAHDPDFVWLTIGQIKKLLGQDNVVNMDTRTVLSGIGYGSYSSEAVKGMFSLAPQGHRNEQMLESALNRECAINDFRKIISWVTSLKSKYDLIIDRVSINDISDWRNKNGRIYREDGKYFSVIGVNVLIENREVANWDQPMIKPAQEGLVGFIVRPINGVYHFLVQAKLEAGNFDIVELAPTVQCLTGNYRTGQNEYSVPYIQDILSAPKDYVLIDTMQSEEGGRFFNEQNRNMVVEVGDSFSVDVPENYCWLTLNQLLRFIEFNNYLNIAARSLISAVKFV